MTTESGSKLKTLGATIGAIVALVTLITAGINYRTAIINWFTAHISGPPSAGPKSGGPNSPGPKAAPSDPSPAPQSSVPVATPSTSPGFTPLTGWQQHTVAVDASGVRISNAGITTATPDTYDMLYNSGNDPGWQPNMNNSDGGALFYWHDAGQGTPNPTACYLKYKDMGYDAAGVAKLGDQYCYVDHNDVVGYLVVTKINAGTVTTAAWLWNKSGSAG